MSHISSSYWREELVDLFKWMIMKLVYLIRKQSISLIVLFILIVYLYNQGQTQSRSDTQIQYLFDIYQFRENLLKENSDKLCEIPSKYKQLADGFCRIYQKKSCDRYFPCHLIYSSQTNLQTIKSSYETGQILRENVSDLVECQLGYSLDLFDKSAYHPSIIFDSLIEFSKDFYFNYLNKYHRNVQTIWTMNFNFESVSNYPWNKDPTILKVYNYTFGYDRTLYDFISRPWLFDYIDKLHQNQFNLTIEQIKSTKKSSILWMNSNCQTKSKRTEYLNEFMKYISIDNYGTCGNNQLVLPQHIIDIQQSKNKDLKQRQTYKWLEGKLALTKEYRFSIAFENSEDYDYITEKLWHPLIMGTVPIYYGAPNVQDWLPCQTDCIIDLRQFQSPKQAAQFIFNILNNQSLYDSYHSWRFKPFKKEFSQMLNYFNRMNNFSFNSILCSLSHQAKRSKDIQQTIQRIKQILGHF